ncbi:MAG: hypothetical protein HOL85_18745, partial [Rhodospirillaceae bacterium]|nr:hypothetical protein [Rhodospirillaceae bacterium]
SAGSILVIDFCLIFVPFGHYDEPEILPYENPSVRPMGADVRQIYEILPKLLTKYELAAVPLLGGHDQKDSTGGNLENRAPFLFEVVRGIVEDWPQPPDPIRGRSFGGVLNTTEVSPRPLPGNRAVLRGLLHRLGERCVGGRVRRIGDDVVSYPTPVPILDRRSIVMRSLGVQPLLYSGAATQRRRTDAGDRVHVYVDVSGSMTGIIGAVYGAIHDCLEWVHPVIHLFSDSVSDANPREISNGIVRSTGGTDIVCVASHMDVNKVRRACIITDGWVGKPTGGHFETLAQAKLGVALIGDSVNPSDLSEVANRIVTLTT